MTASLTVEPSGLRTEMVALGGSLAKLSLPTSHSLMKCAVRTWPAARTGRSAKTMEFDDTPVSVNLLPCKVAPLEFRTARDGIISFFVGPMGFLAGWLMASSAIAGCDVQNRPANNRAIHAMRFMGRRSLPSRLKFRTDLDWHAPSVARIVYGCAQASDSPQP